MADITEELHEAIETEFHTGMERDERLRELTKKAADGSITYTEADEAAKRIGEHSSGALKKILAGETLPDGKMDYNIATGTVAPQLEAGYGAAAELAQTAQQRLNEQAGVGIKAIKPSPDKTAIGDFVDKICSYDNAKDSLWMLGAPVVTFTKDAVTDTVQKNARFLYESGLDLKIRRRSTGFCCKWCQGLIGTFDYSRDLPRDIYRRHANCTCVVECDYWGGKRQNVHSKEVYSREESERRIEEAREYNQEQERVERDRLTARAEMVQREEERQRFIKDVLSQQNTDKVATRQDIHRKGSQEYVKREEKLRGKGQYGPSYITISNYEVLEIVKRYSGTGVFEMDHNGAWRHTEVITENNKIVGVVVDNRNGNSAQTSVFKIHYGKDGIHIVPDYPSKRVKR